VRGEFPQAESLPSLPPVPQSTASSFPPPAPTATSAEREQHRNQEVLHGSMARLGWHGQQLVQYIAQQFGGRRYYQLSPDEVLLLIYRLQNLGAEQP
jgi:hypothetical protein